MIQALHEFFRLLTDRFVATRCPHVAGSLTYTTLLALVPLVTVTLGLFSNFPAFDELGAALGNFLQQNILPELAGQIVATYALQFSDKAAQLTLIGTVMLIVTVLLLLHTIDSVLNDIWGVTRPRAPLTRFAVYWVALTLGPVALAGSIVVTGQVVTTSIAYIGESALTQVFSSMLAPLALLGALFSFLYFAAPNHPVRLVHALIGGFAAAFVFLLMQRLFGLFIARFPTYTLIYGTFAALPIFLVWLYLSWVVVLLGAILAATFPEFFERRHVIDRFPGRSAWAAVNMLLSLAEHQRDGLTADFDALQARSGLPGPETEALLGEMRDAAWVARTEDETWVLTRHPEALSLSQVIERFALSSERWRTASGTSAIAHLPERMIAALQSADMTIAALAARPAPGSTPDRPASGVPDAARPGASGTHSA
ncbi:MAG TPA: YihY family inner membrane protein [Rhodocyclaceae bacterium]|nr:YihY family inner membrane protein [Rhodocyclaceae bacterium]